MQCPSCQVQVEASAGVCPTCGWKFNVGGGKPGPSLVRPAARPKIQCEVELAATVDRTGSSKPFEVGIPLTFETIVRQVAAKARSVRCWVASHGDLDEGQDFVVHTNGGTPDQAVKDIKLIAYGGGGDPPEHHLDAVESLLNKIPWTANPARARGAILAFTTADSKPTRSGISARDLGAEIRRRGILLYLVSEPTPTLQDLVSAAEGLMFQITNSPDPVELQKIAAQR
jgi:hypothetical protein